MPDPIVTRDYDFAQRRTTYTFVIPDAWIVNERYPRMRLLFWIIQLLWGRDA